MIKTIVFDVGGVLVKRDVFATIILGLSQQYNLDPISLRTTASALWEEVSAGKITEKEFWPKLLNSFQLPINLLAEIETQEINLMNPVDPVWGYVNQLHGNYKLAILSNMGERWAKIREEKFKLSKYFNPIIWSYDIKLSKPDIKIFSYLAEKLDNLPAECVFIDDKEENIAAARQCGFKAIHFQNPEQLCDDLCALGVALSLPQTK